jgi:hypothetical protein
VFRVPRGGLLRPLCDVASSWRCTIGVAAAISRTHARTPERTARPPLPAANPAHAGMKEEMMEDAMDDAFADDEDEVRAARSPTRVDRLLRPAVRLQWTPEATPRAP